MATSRDVYTLSNYRVVKETKEHLALMVMQAMPDSKDRRDKKDHSERKELVVRKVILDIQECRDLKV